MTQQQAKTQQPIDAQEIINILTERVGQLELEKAILRAQLNKARQTSSTANGE